MSAARRIRTRRVAVLALGVVVLVLLAGSPAGADSDLFQNVGPASQLPQGALMDAYPLGHYALDHHFPAVKAGVLSGVDVSGLPPTIAWFLAQVLWQITAFLAQTTITLFTFAFSLDLVNGSESTGGQGALVPVSRAVRSIYETTFGAPWLSVAIVIAGLWAIWQALVRRRYTQTAGSLAVSVLLVVLALGLVMQPQRTIGEASRWSNAMSGAFLSLTADGTVANHDQAKQGAADQLFALLVYQPWAVLQFGGLEHCVKTPIAKDPESVAVRPLSTNPGRDAALSSRLRRTGEVAADGKACVNNERKYAPRFLRYSSGSDERDAAHEALKAGDSGKLADRDPAKRDRGYRLSAVDRPAADAMGKGGQYQRLLLVLILFVGELGVLLLLGALSVAVILAQVLVLLLLAFAPVALVLAVLPGRGHEFFLGWLSRLGMFLLRKALYSLILAVLLAVGAALADASSSLGWLMAFGLQAIFYWAVLIYRHQLVGHLTLATTGHRGNDEHGLRLAGVLAATHAITRLHRRASAPAPGPRGQTEAGRDHTAAQPMPPEPTAAGTTDSDRPRAPSDGPADDASPDTSARAVEEQGGPSPDEPVPPAGRDHHGPPPPPLTEPPRRRPTPPHTDGRGPRPDRDRAARPSADQHPRETQTDSPMPEDKHPAPEPPNLDHPDQRSEPDPHHGGGDGATTDPASSPLQRDLTTDTHRTPARPASPSSTHRRRTTDRRPRRRDVPPVEPAVRQVPAPPTRPSSDAKGGSTDGTGQERQRRARP